MNHSLTAGINQNLSQARAEMMDTNSDTLFDAERQELLDNLGIVPFPASDVDTTWIDQLGTLHTIAGRSGFYMKAPCGKVGLLGGCTVRSTCQACL